MKTHKGQIFTTDLIAASVVFLFILTLALAYSSQTAERISVLEKEHERNSMAMQAADALLLSQGSPGNWETHSDLNLSRISSLGIVFSRNQIDSNKWHKLQDWNYWNYLQIKDLLGVQKYGLRISLLDFESLDSLGEFGNQPQTEDSVSSISRIADYNGQKVFVRIKVFRE